MSYIANGRRYTYGIRSTLNQVSTITGMVAGDTVFCTENSRVLTYDGQLWMCSDFIKMTNGSGVTIPRGELAVMSTAAANTITRTNIANPISVVGPIAFGGAPGAPVAVAIFGVYGVITSDSTNAGDFAAGGTATGRVTSGTAMGSGVFGVFVEQRATAGLTRCLLKTKQEYF
jgi:hypothetical protein